MDNYNDTSWTRLDVAAVRRQARAIWERQARAKVPISERIGASVPYWLIAVFVATMILSAGHTILILSILSSWSGELMGLAGSVAFEFGMLYANFRKKQLELRGVDAKQMGSVVGFSRLVFFTVSLINVAGSMLEATKQTNTAALSFNAVLAGFANMPVGTQIAIIISVPVGLIVAKTLEITGEGMAALFLEAEASGDWIERQWARVKQQVEYEALRDAALKLGGSAKDVTKWAWAIVKEDRRPASSVLPAPSEPDKTADNRTDGQADKRTDKTPSTTPRPPQARAAASGSEAAKAWLRDNPAEVMGKPRPTWLADNVADPKLTKQRWSEAIKAVREEIQVTEAVAPVAVSSNGTGAHHDD